MNIIVFDPNPKQSALWLDDIRKSKFILEAAQMLSTAVHFLSDNKVEGIYKPTHVSHPACRWVRTSRDNFQWTVNWMWHMGQQRNPRHKSLSLLPIFEDWMYEHRFPRPDLTPFANCAANASVGVSFKDEPDTCLAYRKYMNERWKMDTIKVTWDYGEKPEWIL